MVAASSLATTRTIDVATVLRMCAGDGEFEMPRFWDYFDRLLIDGGAGE